MREASGRGDQRSGGSKKHSPASAGGSGERRTMGILKKLRRKWRGKVEFTGRTREKARELLLDVVDVFEAAGIDYMLDSGTLLGIMREGDLIQWDNDIDITIPVRELPKLLGVLKVFRSHRRWISMRRFTHAYHHWTERDVRAIKIRSRRMLFFKGRIACDLYIKYPAADAYYWSSMRMVCQADRRFFDRHETVEYRGRRVKIPADAAEYLEKIYGNWRKPDPSYNPTTDDGTILGPLAELGWQSNAAR